MKTLVTILLQLTLFGSLVACDVPPTYQGQQNFDIYFEYGSCLVERFDTAKGSFAHDMGPNEPPVLVNLTLTDEQMDTIYQKIVSIDFFNYPELFVSTPINSDEMGIVNPANHYYLRVKTDETVKAVSWTDEIIRPVTRETEQLRELFQLIITTLEGYPEIKELLMPLVGCL